MAQEERKANYRKLFDGSDFTDEMCNIWRFVRDSMNK